MKQQPPTDQQNIGTRPAGGPDGPGSADSLNAVRTQLTDLLARAEDAFERIRQSDSQSFLSQSRQTGGE